MSVKPVSIRRVPKYERLQRMAERHPELGLEPSAIEAFMTLLSVAGEVAVAAATDLGRHGLAEARFMLLMLLMESYPKPLSHSELAELYGVTKGNITGLVDGLEREGYVRREASGEDRRVTPIALTEAGRRQMQKIVPAHLAKISKLMGELSVGDRRALVALLRKVEEAVPVLKEE